MNKPTSKNTRSLNAAIILASALTAPALAGFGQNRSFQIPLPEVGTKFFFNNGAIPHSNDFDGKTVIDARIEIVLDVFETGPKDPRISSAAFFESEVIVPVDIDPNTEGNQFLNVITTGASEGWSGTGTFTLSRPIEELIGGKWSSPTFYTASTYDGISADEIVIGTINPNKSFITVTVAFNTPECQADMNDDGSLNFFDVSEFLNAFAAGDAAADFNSDGQFNFFDVSEFLNAFSSGCP